MEKYNFSIANSIKAYFKLFIEEITKQLNKANKPYYYMGIFGLTYFIILSVAMNFSQSLTEIILISLRLTALALCFGLCMHDIYFLNKTIRKYLKYYWIFTLMFCFPLISTYTSLASAGNLHWLLSFVVSTFMLYIFSGWYITILLTLIGTSISLILFAYTNYSLLLEVNEEAPLLLSLQVLCSVLILYFLERNNSIREREVENKQLYGNSIAHEVRNSLAAARMFTDLLSDILDKNKKYSKADIKDIKEMIPSIKLTLNQGMETIKNILYAVKSDINNADDVGIHSIKFCVQSAIDSMHLNRITHNRIKLSNNKGFQFKGSAHFVKHVIINLLSNSIKYAGNDAEIKIWCKSNQLHIKDNGVGISSDLLDHLFHIGKDDSEVKGTGVGLAFCARVMEEMSGTIKCKSKIGKYTHFILTFTHT